tara:strand:- start:107 stop:1009 length:903 start_codon:yes stop_codon:yes gene_type:complete
LKDGLKFAAIDIGSNAMRLLFMRVIVNSKPIFIKESLMRMPLRLGHDAFRYGEITQKTAQKFMSTIKGFNSLIKAYDPIDIRACATSAMRSSSNGINLVKKTMLDTGLDIEIISGKEEANLIIANHIERITRPDFYYIHIDVGGGSTEISVICNKQVISSKSFSIGSVRLLENKVRKIDWSKMKKWIRKNTSDLAPIIGIGSGGNINKILSILGKKKGDKIKVQSLSKTIEKINLLNYKDRIVKLGLRPDRADVITHAGLIYRNCLVWSGAKNIIVPQVGLPDGIITKLFLDYQKDNKIS